MKTVLTRIAMALAAGVAMQTASAADGVRCTELIDAASGKQLVREGQCDKRMPPMSTFKIAISLMGYDTGVLVFGARHGVEAPSCLCGQLFW